MVKNGHSSASMYYTECKVKNKKKTKKTGEACMGTRLLHCGKVGCGIDPATEANH